ncbi:MAG: ABC transporter ATP-binding protein [Candidatus Hodarchaeota archaeon]
MILPVNGDILPLISVLLIEIIIIGITFMIGIFITKNRAIKMKWDDSFKIILTVNLLWLFIDLFTLIVFLNFLGPFLLTNLLRIGINIFVGTMIMMYGFMKGLRESIEFIIFIQIIIFCIAISIEHMLRLLHLIFSTTIRDITPAGLTYLLCFLALLGVSIFYSYWGNKMQLVENKVLISIISFTAGSIFLTHTYYQQFGNFIDNFYVNLLLGATISILTGFVLKKYAYTKIPIQKIRVLTVLEKNKMLLQVNDLKVYYPLIGGMLKRQFGAVKAVDGISFKLRTGETLGLVGESGCGKTTVANAILGLVEIEGGEIKFHDKNIPNDYPKYLRQKIQMVFQDPDASLNPRMKVVDIIAEPLINLLGINEKDDVRIRVLKLLDAVSLKREHMDRYPHEFSGGQKQRIVIARALASNPELIILDEPTSALDVSVQAQILNLLKELQKTYGYGFLFITHNLAVVNHVANRVAVMYLGKIVEVGSTEQIFSNPTHPYTQALLASRTEIDPFDKEIKFVIRGEVPSPIAPPPGCTFNPRCVSDARTKECEFELPHKIKIEEGHYIWCVNPPISKDST